MDVLISLHGVDKVLRYGIAFSGKDTCVKAE